MLSIEIRILDFFLKMFLTNRCNCYNEDFTLYYNGHVTVERQRFLKRFFHKNVYLILLLLDARNTSIETFVFCLVDVDH